MKTESKCGCCCGKKEKGCDHIHCKNQNCKHCEHGACMDAHCKNCEHGHCKMCEKKAK